jgi:acetyl esterase/lipase
MADRVGDCQWSYLTYFFGFAGLNWASNQSSAAAQFARRRDFFAQGAMVNPLRADLSSLPPMLILSGGRDYFYSDGPALAKRACDTGARVVQLFQASDGFHDFIEYSEGCGGGAPMAEALDAYERIADFVREDAPLVSPTPRA